MKFALLFLFSSSLFASPLVRWTYHEDPNSDFTHILRKISDKTGVCLSSANYKLAEDRRLAFYRYKRYEPLKGLGGTIRLWIDPTGRLLQMEAARSPKTRSESSEAKKFLRAETVTGENKWVRRESLLSATPILSDRLEHISPISVKVYPYKEEFNGKILERIPVELKYLYARTQRPVVDPFAAMNPGPYFLSKEDPVLGATPTGQKQGYWSRKVLESQAKALLAKVPTTNNHFPSEGMAMMGKYVSTVMHPEAPSTFKGIQFTPQFAPFYYPIEKEIPVGPSGKPDRQYIPGPAYFAKTFHSLKALWDADATRYPDNNTTAYINSGFDQIQMYWTITHFFEAFQKVGFIDERLSTEPVTAVVYDPYVWDSAYYNANQMHFGRYTPTCDNGTRNSTTIRHEMGHGLMERLMGSHLSVNPWDDGVYEGLADFALNLVTEDIAAGALYPGHEEERIFNPTLFYVTNESHDGGEAWGGMLRKILEKAIKRWGHRQGLTKTADLFLETMRLTRDHPNLMLPDWILHLRFADELGRKGVRKSGEFAAFIEEELSKRNYSPDPSKRARFEFKFAGIEVGPGTIGNWDNPEVVNVPKGQIQTRILSTRLTSGKVYAFKYPLKVRVNLGNEIHWQGEEQGPLVYSILKDGDPLDIPLVMTGCDSLNEKNGCRSRAVVEIFNAGEQRSVAKKRFYIYVKPNG